MATRISIKRIVARPAERRVLVDAGRRLEIIINSRAFSRAVLEHRYRGAPRFANNTIRRHRLGNAQIHAVLMAGRETLSPKLDYEWDMDLHVYSGRRRTVGYTSPGITTVYMNRRVLDFSPDGLSAILANMAHEHCHKLGFGHDKRRTRRRPFSVPYGVGSITRRLHRSLP